MPSYKLTYFAAKGRGEYIRLILIAAGQKWEENVVQFPDWPSMKAGTFCGCTPFRITFKAYVLCSKRHSVGATTVTGGRWKTDRADVRYCWIPWSRAWWASAGFWLRKGRFTTPIILESCRICRYWTVGTEFGRFCGGCNLWHFQRAWCRDFRGWIEKGTLICWRWIGVVALRRRLVITCFRLSHLPSFGNFDVILNYRRLIWNCQ